MKRQWKRLGKLSPNGTRNHGISAIVSANHSFCSSALGTLLLETASVRAARIIAEDMANAVARAADTIVPPAGYELVSLQIDRNTECERVQAANFLKQDVIEDLKVKDDKMVVVLNRQDDILLYCDGEGRYSLADNKPPFLRPFAPPETVVVLRKTEARKHAESSQGYEKLSRADWPGCEGWLVLKVRRMAGNKTDNYYYPPNYTFGSKRWKSKTQVDEHLKRNGSPCNQAKKHKGPNGKVSVVNGDSFSHDDEEEEPAKNVFEEFA